MPTEIKWDIVLQEISVKRLKFGIETAQIDQQIDMIKDDRDDAPNITPRLPHVV